MENEHKSKVRDNSDWGMGAKVSTTNPPDSLSHAHISPLPPKHTYTLAYPDGENADILRSINKFYWQMHERKPGFLSAGFGGSEKSLLCCCMK